MIKTVNVFCRLLQPDGTPGAGTRIEFRLPLREIDDGVMLPQLIVAEADTNGEVTVPLWPNENGLESSYYDVTIFTCSRITHDRIVVPDADCNLHDIMQRLPFPPIDVAQQAVTAAQKAAAEAQYWAGQAGQGGGGKGEKGDKGDKGDPGNSAYQEWLNLGHTGTEQDFINSLKGDKGDPGKDGAKGDTGERGLPGEAGAKGDQGEPGKDGIDGKDGERGAQGIQGVPGIKGETGERGLPGEKGDTGQPGAKGETGAPGERGAKGDTGLTGAAGADGRDGKDGANGHDGQSAYQVWLSLGHAGTEADFIASLKGQPGEPGLKGDKGDTGATGAQGEQGIKGDTGAMGPKGDKGDQGEPGAILPGTIGIFAMRTAPEGWVKANGAALGRVPYAALFSAIGTTFGAGDGSTTFNVPDLRGLVIRGWDDGRGIDAGRGFGSYQSDMIRNITGSFYGISGGADGRVFTVKSSGGAVGSFSTIASLTQYGFNAAGMVPTGAENTVKNMALLMCIKI